MMARTVDRVIGRSITVSRERERLHPPRWRTERGQKSKDFPIIRGKINSITFWSSVQWRGEGRERGKTRVTRYRWSGRRAGGDRKVRGKMEPLALLSFPCVGLESYVVWPPRLAIFSPSCPNAPTSGEKRGEFLCEVEERRKVMMASGGGGEKRGFKRGGGI